MRKLLFIFLITFTVPSLAQISIKYTGPLKDLLTNIENQYGYKFMYSNNDFDLNQIISINIENSDIETILKEISGKSDLSYVMQKKQILLKNNIQQKKEITPQGEVIKEPDKQIQISSFKKPVPNIISTVKTDTPEITDSLNTQTSSSKDSHSENTPEIKPDKQIITLQEEEPVEKNITGDSSNELSNTKNDSLNTYINSETYSSPLVNNIADTSENFIKGDLQLQDKSNEVHSDNIQNLEINNTNLNKTNGYYTKQEHVSLFKFGLHSNLLYSLAVTPNLGIEIKYKNNLSAVINGLWMHLDWKEGDRCYRIWSIMPEVRYYLQNNNNFYVGIMFNVGQLNFKFNETGNQGNFMGGGITGGYIFNIKERFKLDFGLGFGYLNYKYETYNFINEINIRKDSGTNNLWIPIKIGITLIWNIN